MYTNSKKRVVILGAGIGGLSLGWTLSKTGDYEIIVIEKSSKIGGVCGTFKINDFLLDYGPHKFYSVFSDVVDEIKNLMKDEFIIHRKRNSIFLFNNFLEYPLSFLDLIKKLGIRKPFSLAKNSLLNCISTKKINQPLSYQDYIINQFGEKIYNEIFKPLAKKIWGDPLYLSSDIASTRIPTSNVLELTLRVLKIKKETAFTDAKYFYYPKKGFGEITERMAEEIINKGGKILIESEPSKIITKDNTIKGLYIKKLDKEEYIPCDILVSSIHLDSLLSIFDSKDSLEFNRVFNLAKNLPYRGVILVYIFLNKPSLLSYHWIFFPEERFVFSRIYETTTMSKKLAPQNKTVICCDFTDTEDGFLWNQKDYNLIKRCIEDLTKLGVIQNSWVEDTYLIRIPKFYPCYQINYKENLKEIFSYFKKFNNLLLVGRIGFYNYNNSDHCVDMAKFISKSLSENKPTSIILEELFKKVTNYKIVD